MPGTASQAFDSVGLCGTAGLPTAASQQAMAWVIRHQPIEHFYFYKTDGNKQMSISCINLLLGHRRYAAALSRLLASVPLAVVIGSVSLPAQAGLTFTTTFDASVLAVGGASAAINNALGEYTTLFSDNVNIKLKFLYSGNGLGSSGSLSGGISYAAVYNRMTLDQTSADDNAAMTRLAVDGSLANPVNGSGNLAVGRPTLKAMGMDSFFDVDAAFGYNNANYFDGIIDLNLGIMNLDRISIDPNKYDLKAVTQHEVDEVMGTISAVGQSDPRAIDLFRFDGAGNRSFTSNPNAAAYFSINGTTDLAQYNQTGIGDYGDFISCPFGAPIPQVQDACSSPGGTPNLNVELRMLDVVGWDRIAPQTVPEPGSLALLSLALLGLAASRRKR